MPEEPATLQHALMRAASFELPKHVTFVRGSAAESCISHSDLLAEVSSLGGWLAEQGVKRSEPVIVAPSSNESFVRSFWSCLFAGAVPVPLVAPSSWSKANPILDRFSNASRLLGYPRVIVDTPAIDDPDTPAHVRDRALVLPRQVPRSLTAPQRDWTPDEIALIQFSSGSTGEPRGVALTHRNVMMNLAAIRAGVMATPDDTAVSWMPLHHDFGLIGVLLGSISSPNDVVLIETAAFIRRPLLWLDVLHAHRATITVAPNFGQMLVLSRLHDTSGWDLSAVRVIFNGAEPISPRVMEAFCAALAPAGLRDTAMLPVYGLAEATLAVTFSDLGTPPRVVSCDRLSLRTGCRAREADVSDPQALRIVSVGRPVQHCAVQIADDDDRVVEDGTVGHLQVRGDNVMTGYFHDDEATTGAFHDGWLRTGDLGFMRDAHLFITGRVKDVLFVNGENLYAHDIEEAAMQAPAAAGRRVAVCAWRNGIDASDRILVFVASSHPDKDVAVFRAIEERLASVFGLRPHAMIPLISSHFPRTTSGKLQRHRLRERFERGEFDEAVGHLARALAGARIEGRVGPGSETESLVHAIWARELGLKPHEFGVHEPFEYLGGTSLSALAIAQAIEDQMGMKVSSDVVQRLPTVAAMAAHVGSVGRLRLPGQRPQIFRG